MKKEDFNIMNMMNKMNDKKNNDDILSKIKDVKPNKEFANELYGAYGGQYGELSAITQYIYEEMVLHIPELSSEIRTIAIQEMRHLNILGKLLNKLGLPPFFKGVKDNIWCGTNVRYKYCSLKDMFDYNIKIEQIAIEEYLRLISITNDTNIIKIFEEILSQERVHLATFEKLKRIYT